MIFFDYFESLNAEIQLAKTGLSGFLIRKEEDGASAPESILIWNVISGSIENADAPPII